MRYRTDVIAENGVMHSLASDSTISALENRIEVVHYHSLERRRSPGSSVMVRKTPFDSANDYPARDAPYR